MKKKAITYLMTFVMLLSLLSVGAGAVNINSAQTEPPSIPEEVAEIMAMYFVRDAQTIPDNTWTEDTSIADVVTMYNSDDTVSAYSFELKTSGEDAGYVVISAYPDVENKILEFSDTAAPVYENLDLNDGDTVVYTGGLNYFKEVGEDSLISVSGSIVCKEDVATPLEDSRSVAYSQTIPTSAEASTLSSDPIADPFVWAQVYYGGTFTATEWKNAFENYCRFRTTGDFSVVNGVTYDNHCCPTAITNLIEIVARYRNYSGVPYSTTAGISNVFYKVANLGIQKNYYKISEGTYYSTSAAYVKESFALFNISTSVSEQAVNYNNVKTAINNYNLMLIELQVTDPIYKNHAVAGYAYTCLQNTSGTTVGFVKIADGWNSTGRFLPLNSAAAYEKMDVISIGTLG